MKTRKAATSGTKRKRGKKKGEPPRLKVPMPGKAELQTQLDRTKGNLAQVAAGFGVHRRTVGRWIVKLGMVVVSVEVGQEQPIEARPTQPHAASGPPPDSTQPEAASPDQAGGTEAELEEAARNTPAPPDLGPDADAVPPGNAGDCNPVV